MICYACISEFCEDPAVYLFYFVVLLMEKSVILLFELLSSLSLRYVSMIKSYHSLISFLTFSTCVPLPVLLKSNGFMRMSLAHELIL